jgi:hypothetical protein
MTFAARFRAFAWFIVAVVYFIIAKSLAEHAALGLASGD